MSVLKVRDNEGNVTEILTIKGEPGEKGDPGENIHEVLLTDYYTMIGGTVRAGLELNKLVTESGFYLFKLEDSVEPVSVENNVPTYKILVGVPTATRFQPKLVGSKALLMYVSIEEYNDITFYRGVILDRTTYLGEIPLFGMYAFEVVNSEGANSYADGIISNHIVAKTYCPLKFTGAVSAEFNGDEVVTVNIPSAVTDYISYAATQELDDEQKQQARDNIGAPSADNPVMTGTFSMGRKADTTIGDKSHAEGNETTAEGQYSHAEGNATVANGGMAHAEGNKTRASKAYAHAEGNQTVASGTASHSEGTGTTATNEGAHAEGSQTQASGIASHAEGMGTIARGTASHAEGQFNVEDTEFTYAHVVGNGNSANERSNAHTLDWEGNAWFAGDVYVGSTSGTNRDDGSKKLATEEYVNSRAGGSGGFVKKAELTVNILGNAFRATAAYTPSSDNALVLCHIKDAYLTNEVQTWMMCAAEYTGGEIRVVVTGVGGETHGATTAIVEVFEAIYTDETTKE